MRTELNFPDVPEPPPPGHPPMDVLEYTRFCLECLDRNPHITPENVMTTRMDEWQITEPFRLIHDDK